VSELPRHVVDLYPSMRELLSDGWVGELVGWLVGALTCTRTYALSLTQSLTRLAHNRPMRVCGPLAALDRGVSVKAHGGILCVG